MCVQVCVGHRPREIYRSSRDRRNAIENRCKKSSFVALVDDERFALIWPFATTEFSHLSFVLHRKDRWIWPDELTS